MSVTTGFGGFLSQLIRRRERGLALFDVILAVGVIGILISGGVLLVQTVQERIKRNETLQALNLIRAEAQRIYAGRPDMTGLTMLTLWRRGSLPDGVPRGLTSTQLTPTSYEHAYDYKINVWPVTGKKQYIIGLQGLDDGPCADILGAYAEKSRIGSGVLSLGVGSEAANTLAIPTVTDSVIDGGTAAVGDAASPVPTATIDSWCVQGDSDNNAYFHFQG